MVLAAVFVGVVCDFLYLGWLAVRSLHRYGLRVTLSCAVQPQLPRRRQLTRDAWDLEADGE